MNDFDLGKYLQDNGVSNIQTTVSGYLASCPFPDHPDHNPSWVIYKYPPYRYSCFGCKRRGNLRQLKRELGWEGKIPGEDDPLEVEGKQSIVTLRERLEKLDSQLVVEQGIDLPDDFIHMEHSSYRDMIYDYLAGRGVLEEVLNNHDAYKFGISVTYPTYLIMPIIENNKVVYWTSRSYKQFVDKAKRFKNPPNVNGIGKALFLYSPYLPQPEVREGFVVEGQFDAIKLLSYKVNAVATFNASPSDMQIRKIIRSFDVVNVMYDDDPAGNSGAEHLAKVLKEFGVETYRVITSAEDAGAYEQKDYFLGDVEKRVKM